MKGKYHLKKWQPVFLHKAKSQKKIGQFCPIVGLLYIYGNRLANMIVIIGLAWWIVRMASSLSKRAATFAMGEAPLREWGAPMFTDETGKKGSTYLIVYHYGVTRNWIKFDSLNLKLWLVTANCVYKGVILGMRRPPVGRQESLLEFQFRI